MVNDHGHHPTQYEGEFGPVDRLETRHFLVGPEMGEDIDVVLEKGKVLHIKTLTPGIEVGVYPIYSWKNVSRTMWWCVDQRPQWQNFGRNSEENIGD